MYGEHVMSVACCSIRNGVLLAGEPLWRGQEGLGALSDCVMHSTVP
jgi:hypothetical protein